MGMDLVTIILASVLSLLFILAMFARPTITIAHGKILYLDGIIAAAIIMGAMVWALIEALTPPGGMISLIWRAGIGILAGGAAGAYLGYSFNFAQYIIIPLYNGNFFAQIYAVSILIFGLAVIWDAAWSHRHGYMGQGAGKKAKKTGFKESGRSKGYRKMIALIFALIFVFLAIPLSSDAGNAFASLNDHNGISIPVTSYQGLTPSGNVSSSSFSIVNAKVIGISNTTLSSSSAISSNSCSPLLFVNTFQGYLPTYTTVNKTGANTTHYIQTTYITSNLSIGTLASLAMQNIYLSMVFPGEFNLTMGTGNISDFSPLESISHNQTMNVSYYPCGSSGPVGVAIVSPDVVASKTYASFNFAISPSMLTGNQSHTISFEIQTHNQTELKMYYFAVGASSPTLIGPIQLDSVGYVIGSLMTLTAALLVAPWIDLKPLPGVRNRRGRA